MTATARLDRNLETLDDQLGLVRVLTCWAHRAMSQNIEDTPNRRQGPGCLRCRPDQASRMAIFQAPMASQPRIQPAMTAAMAQVGMGGRATG